MPNGGASLGVFIYLFCVTVVTMSLCVYVCVVLLFLAVCRFCSGLEVFHVAV